jgi:hypothetical protein
MRGVLLLPPCVRACVLLQEWEARAGVLQVYK